MALESELWLRLPQWEALRNFCEIAMFATSIIEDRIAKIIVLEWELWLPLPQIY